MSTVASGCSVQYHRRLLQLNRCRVCRKGGSCSTCKRSTVQGVLCPPPPCPCASPRFSLCAILACLLVGVAAHRFCDPQKLDEVDQENGLTEEEMTSSLEYLIRGKFRRREGDQVGRVAMLWLSIADLDASSLTEEAIDEALEAWEAEEARLRAEAARRARARA